MTSKFRKWVAGLAIVALTAVPVLAQFNLNDLLQEPQIVPVTVGADDDSALLLIRSFKDASFEVNAGDITFYSTEVGATTADDEFECPVSGALGGIIDTTNGSCDTLGEIVDVINASTSWRAVILDGNRDTALTTTGLLVKSQTNSSVLEGVEVHADSSTQTASYRAVVPPGWRTIDRYLVGNSQTLVDQPFKGTQTILYPLNQSSAFSSGAARLYVEAVKPDLDDGSQTLSTIWNEVTAATTTFKLFEFGGNGLIGPPDSKLVVRVDDGTGTVGTFLLAGTGAFGRYKK